MAPLEVTALRCDEIVCIGKIQACTRHAGNPERAASAAVSPSLAPRAAHCQRRYEAQRLPDVVTSSIDPRAYDSRRTAYAPAAEAVPRAPDFARPSRQWLREFLTDFQAVRDHLARSVTDSCRLFHDAKPCNGFECNLQSPSVTLPVRTASYASAATVNASSAR